ncbi:thiosulfate oxidation carrier complex protein SoxZ [[Pseudomonas] carboxydohydrogena]|nr:thiosulfate oxidation carrier complex protein SoxZ [[Pseudomonas] carboxydohydrogena]
MMASIRVRAIAGADTTEVQALVQHPMDSGFVKDSKGQLIPPHHIETVQFETGGKVVFTALWGPAVSKDPFVKFSFKGGKKGDDLKITWIDNKGETDTTTAKIA